MQQGNGKPLFSEAQPPLELSMRGFILGALITLVFTSSNVYLGLKVGLTFSSSIPAAVISMAVLSFFSRPSILENNMVQTQASAAGTLSAVIFVLPGLLMIGYWQDFHFWQTMLICFSGGALGVIFSVPLRRTMVVNSTLPYPEGVAAAEILIAGHKEEGADENAGGAKDILFGGIVAAIVSFITTGLQLLTDKASIWLVSGRAVFHIPFGFSLALVSAGYLMGMTAGFAMLVGVIAGWGVFVPILTSQAGWLDGQFAETAMRIWTEKVRFIGAGTLAVASVWTLITLLKPMIEGIKLSLGALHAAHDGTAERTDTDLSGKTLLLLCAGLLMIMAVTFHSFVMSAPLSPVAGWGLVVLATLLAFIIGFFIAAACGYMAGLIGSSNSPISGIGVVAIIIISFVLVSIDLVTPLFETPEARQFGMALAIFVTTAVVSVATISNDNLQDLKTGFLIGATPRNQQIALLVGCAVGACVIAPMLGILYEAYGFSGAPLPRAGMDAAETLSAPQATLMMTVAKGIFAHNLDWTMFIIGLGFGACVIALDVLLAKIKSPVRLAALAVGLGMYLPASVTMAVVVGGVLNVLVGRKLKAKGQSSDAGEGNKRGVLMASGFIVGESLMGVALAILVLVSLSMGFSDAPLALNDAATAIMGADSFTVLRYAASVAVFALVCGVFYKKSI